MKTRQLKRLNIYNVNNYKLKLNNINQFGFNNNNNIISDINISKPKPVKQRLLLSTTLPLNTLVNNSINKINSHYKLSNKIDWCPITREWSSGKYFYNNSEYITTLNYEKLIYELIQHYFNGKTRSYLLSLTSYKYSNNTLIINLFYYKLQVKKDSFNNNNNNKNVNHVLNTEWLSQLSLDKLNARLSKLINKVVKLKFTRIYYPYLDSNIFSQYLAILLKSNSFYRIKSILTKKFNIGFNDNSNINPGNNYDNISKLLNKVFIKQLVSDTGSMIDSNSELTSELKPLNEDNNNNNITKIAISNIFNNINKSNMINNYLKEEDSQRLLASSAAALPTLPPSGPPSRNIILTLFLILLSYKNVSGLSITLKGRMTRRKSATRSRMSQYTIGSFTNYSPHLLLLRKQYNCNVDIAKFTKSNNNGLYTVKVSLAHK